MNGFCKFISANKAKIELVERKWTQNTPLLAKLTPVFWPFWVQKSRFLDFFKVVLDLFRKCLGIIFGLKGPTFG